jgi:hypothetical protein
MGGAWHKNYPKTGALDPIPGREIDDPENGGAEREMAWCHPLWCLSLDSYLYVAFRCVCRNRASHVPTMYYNPPSSLCTVQIERCWIFVVPSLVLSSVSGYYVLRP